MIIIDTSVWIEFFRQNKKLVREVRMLVDAMIVRAYEPVFSELLFGARDERERKVILSWWKSLPKASFLEGDMLAAASFASEQKLYAKGIGLMDAAIIQATMLGEYRLWTLDKGITQFLDQAYLYNNSDSDSDSDSN